MDTTSKVVLANVQVLTAGTRMEQDQEKGKPVQVTVVTLLVTPEQAERLALASTEGKIQLALRNPLDQGAPPTPGMQARRPARTRAGEAGCKGTARRPRDGEARSTGDDGGSGRAADADRGNHPRRQARNGSHQVARCSASAS